jgi:rsbT co-antagonist protein RsbR
MQQQGGSGGRAAERGDLTREAREQFFELTTDLLSVVGPEGYFVELSPSWERTLGYSLDELRAAPFMSFVHPEDHDATLAVVMRLSAGETVAGFVNRYRRKDGGYAWLEWSGRASGVRQPIYAVARDVTARREAEAALRAADAALLALSTPLIPISDEILVMPLIGVIDSRRAAQVLETLLQGIVDRRAQVAILDITGVGVVDTQVAEALLRVARAAQLLGAEMVLTGIRPDVAQTLVTLGADLSKVVTRSTLQAGIEHAMQRRAGSARR